MTLLDRATTALCASICAAAYGRILLEDENFSVVGVCAIAFLIGMSVRQCWKMIRDIF